MDPLDDDIGEWRGIPALFVLVVYATVATLAVAGPTLLLVGVGYGAIGAWFAFACWIAMHAAFVSVAYLKTRDRSRLALCCALVSLGIWSIGLFAVQFLRENPFDFLYFIVATKVETVFDLPAPSGKGNYIPPFDGPIVDESGWGMFAVVIFIAAILDFGLLVIFAMLSFVVLVLFAPVPRRGRCDGCGYDIRASIQFGRCPECGMSISTSPRNRHVARE